MTWSPWIRDAVQPTADEVAQVRTGLPKELLRGLRDATAPSGAEVDAFLANRELAAWKLARRQLRTRQLAFGAAALAAAAVLTTVVALRPAAYGPLPVALGEHTALTAAPLLLGPSIEVVGDADLVVAQADTERTVVDLVEGRGLFEVDPAGEYRHLLVRAGDTEVEVKGTRFTVTHVSGVAGVDVERGVVEVRHGGEAFVLTAGMAWAEPVPVASEWAPVEDSAPVEVVAAAEVEAPAPTVGAIRQMRHPAPKIAAPPAPMAPASPTDRDVVRAFDARIAAHEPIDALLADMAEFPKRYPTSPYRQKVELDRFALFGDHSPRRAVLEMDAWMELNPSSPIWMSVAETRAKTAQRRLHDPGLALPTWRALAGQPGMRGAEAAANQGLCALAVGLNDEAKTAFRLALARDVPEPLKTEVLTAMADKGWKAK